MATTASPSLSTPERLLAAAERIVVHEGVHALTVRGIADAAGVNSALVRYHFGDVDGLLRDLALRNAARIADARTGMLDALERERKAAFPAVVDALVVPLFASAAMTPGFRAIVVLDEMFSRAADSIHEQIWSLFAEGVDRVTRMLSACQPEVDAVALAWRIRFVTAAALDIPPRDDDRSPQGERRSAYGDDGDGERLEQFRCFARDALNLSR